MATWDDLAEELDSWHGSGRCAAFWWRDDDAVRVTPALERLLALSKERRRRWRSRSYRATPKMGYATGSPDNRWRPCCNMDGATPIMLLMGDGRVWTAPSAAGDAR